MGAAGQGVALGLSGALRGDPRLALSPAPAPVHVGRGGVLTPAAFPSAASPPPCSAMTLAGPLQPCAPWGGGGAGGRAVYGPESMWGHQEQQAGGGGEGGVLMQTRRPPEGQRSSP